MAVRPVRPSRVPCGALVLLLVLFSALAAAHEPLHRPLAELNCPTLEILLRALPDPDAAHADPAVRRGLVDAIVERPGCGDVQGALLRAGEGSGALPFDAGALGGFAPEEEPP